MSADDQVGCACTLSAATPATCGAAIDVPDSVAESLPVPTPAETVETPGAVTVFLVLQGVLYGFGLWWAMYLYVWYLLAVLAWLLRRMDNAFGWAVFSGAYGLCFGGLCAAVYLVAKTPAFALSWWLSGLSYDVMHGAGNFVIMLLLYRPLRTALQTAKRQIRL